ncbi:MAG: hypothetical protein SGI97_03675 [candidate division Zixibacteria bacterium]|nr:hypothetical protein [candidate division Zixibacteria bacterium]
MIDRTIPVIRKGGSISEDTFPKESRPLPDIQDAPIDAQTARDSGKE